MQSPEIWGPPLGSSFRSQFFQGRNQIRNTLDLWEKDLEKASAGKKREKERGKVCPLSLIGYPPYIREWQASSVTHVALGQVCFLDVEGNVQKCILPHGNVTAHLQ